MRVLIAALGSRGDVAPFVGLGQRLATAGHEVTVAAHTEFAPLVRSGGLGFAGVAGDARSISDFPRGWRSSPRFLAEQARRMTRYLEDAAVDLLAAARHADVLLVNLTAMFGYEIADGLGIPGMGVYCQPVEPTGAFPPIFLHSARSLGSLGNRVAGRVALASLTPYHRAAARVRAELGSPPRSRRDRARRRREQRWPVLHGYSAHVLPRPADWRQGLEVVGYWPAHQPAGWSPPADLMDFLDAGPAPVFIGFGSMAAGQDGWLSETVAEAVRRAGVRAVVQAGWAGLESAGPDVLTIGDVPHSWLFPQMAAVVHHGGAGTTGAAFIAGTPSVAVPVYADQPLWGERIRALGAGPAPLPFTALTAQTLAERIRDLQTGRHRTAAAEIGRRVRTEDGAARVVEALSTLPG
ncbi:glycosyltransferase [Pseudonocardia cypriaca]|uniref:UDP:flavonoid glycosyltransferase YjiC (YdhE family) n=1 Tax=Pseudonocardia cypriaca TaxID=882449 RepID=A0A543GGC6_9PSEU|nr:glycosyltransferase [Pseudonocardia cypriaca]TQM45139.1 UDP:flavonoid glycosyltransferase YjiC (YdhE family) [Pseudonocardia cypriaca]